MNKSFINNLCDKLANKIILTDAEPEDSQKVRKAFLKKIFKEIINDELKALT